jgi:DNA-binding transcriptional regulator of glucitol operon
MPWATIMTAILVAIAAIAGAVVVIRNPNSLSFQQYLDILKNFALAVGVVGIGRGIASFGKQTAAATLLKDQSLVPPVTVTPGANGVVASDVLSYVAGGMQDPYADVAWVEAPPPPQPVAAADRPPNEI